MHGIMRWSAGLWLMLAGPAVAAGPMPDATVPPKASEQIVADLARADLDAVSADAAKYMGTESAQRIKNSFASIKNFGQSQYTELIYTREFGKTEQDIIYKIDFDKAFAFVRFLWHIDNGNWHLVHLSYSTEDEQPLPKEWLHIYPK